ncbi:MAG: hypothetical protein IPM57_11950 [Oligoflexia bacterium]|nr:hypothetical protein [Oligoflexia bacterium]
MFKKLALILLSILLFNSNASWATVNKKCNVLFSMFNVQNFIKPDPTASNKSVPKDEANLIAKAQNLSKAIAKLNKNKGPDFMGFAEIGGLEHLQLLLEQPEMKKRGYKYVAVNEIDAETSQAKRIIRVGFISKLKILKKPKSHVYWDQTDPLWGNSKSRPILEVVLEMPNGEPVIVFINHWASKLKGQWSMLRRYQAGVFLREKVEKILNKNPDANIMIMGDFNTDPSSVEILTGLRATPNPADPGSSYIINEKELLYNLHDTLGSRRADTKAFKKRYPEATGEQWKKFYEKLGRKYGTYYDSTNQVWMNFRFDIYKFREKNPNATKKELENFYADLAEKYAENVASKQNNWDVLDQILVSKNMLLYLVEKSYKPVHTKPFTDTKGHPNEFNNKTNKGLSDHLPIIVEFSF